MPIYFLLKNIENIEYNSNVDSNWFSELNKNKDDFPIEFSDVVVVSYLDSYMKSFLRKKNSKQFFVFLDPTDIDTINDYVYSNFDLILKYQCNKIYLNDKKVVVPPYPFSGGLIPEQFKENKSWENRDIDIFFVGGYSDPKDINNLRVRIVREVKNRFKEKFVGGINVQGLDVSCESIPQNDFYEIMSRTKISLSFCQRENQRGMDRRLVESFLSGSCVVTHPFGVVPFYDFKDKEHLAYTNEKISDVCEVIDHLLKNDNEAKKIAGKGNNLFKNIYLNQGKWLHEYLKIK